VEKKWGPGLPGGNNAGSDKRRDDILLDDNSMLRSDDNLGDVHGEKIDVGKTTKLILRIFCLLIAAAAAIISGCNSYEFFIRLRPGSLSVLSAIAIVGSASILPDFCIYFNRNNRKWLSAGLGLISCIAIFLCMITTLAALYNTKTERTKIEYAQENQNQSLSSLVMDARREKDRLQAEIIQTNGLISSTQEKIDSIKTEDTLSDTSQVLVSRLNKYLKQKDKYESRLAELDSIISKSSGEIKPQRQDFYSFLSGILKTDNTNIEFWVGAIPAVFLEIISPVMLGLALFL